MAHPLTMEVPSLEFLTQAHAQYMLRLAESERKLCEDVVNHLNMNELFAIAGQALGSECYRADKIYQGGFNQIFNLTFHDNKISAIARINMPHGGGAVAPEQERYDRVASEVATLKWLKRNTQIPVPDVYAYNINPSNAIEAAFIIQERMLGRPLSDIWRDLGVKDRTTIIQQLAQYQRELYSTSFSQIGSLYEDKNGSGFHIGRWAPPVRLERALTNRGPWSTSREQLESFMAEQIMEIDTDAEKLLDKRKEDSEADNSNFNIDEFRALYDAILHVVNHVEIWDRWPPSFSLSHPDYSLHNILVGYHDPTHVVGMIDWEGARIQPWWATVVMPDFMWDEMDVSTLPAEDTDTGATWDDVIKAWNKVLLDNAPPDFNSTEGRFLSKLSQLVDGNWVIWATVESVVDDIMEWRLEWPQVNDPAFSKLDEIIRRYRPESNF